jgi:hypothetical protein
VQITSCPPKVEQILLAHIHEHAHENGTTYTQTTEAWRSRAKKNEKKTKMALCTVYTNQRGTALKRAKKKFCVLILLYYVFSYCSMTFVGPFRFHRTLSAVKVFFYASHAHYTPHTHKDTHTHTHTHTHTPYSTPHMHHILITRPS